MLSISSYFKIISQCLICNSWSNAAICSSCEKCFFQPDCFRCLGCCSIIVFKNNNELCGKCINQSNYFDCAYTAVDYQYPWNKLIASFKFRSQFTLATLFANYLKRITAVVQGCSEAQYLIPIPLSKPRLCERGFNQASLLAKAIDKDKTKCNWLTRVKHSQPLHQMRKSQRAAQIKSAFKVTEFAASKLHNQHILLVDDVMTSGATLNEAAKTLKLAGVAKVTVVVFAKTPIT